MKSFHIGISFKTILLCLLLPVFAFCQEVISAGRPLADYRNGQAFPFYEKNPHWLMFQDSKGFLWGFDQSNHLIRFDGKEVEVFYSDPNDSTKVQCVSKPYYFLQEKDGKIWISLEECALERFDPETERFEHFADKFRDAEGFTPGFFGNLFRTRSGTILAGVQAGMYAYVEEDGLFHKIGKAHQRKPLYEDEQGNIVVVHTHASWGFLQQLDQNWSPVTGEIKLPGHQYPDIEEDDLLVAAYPIKHPSKKYPSDLIFMELGNLFTYNLATNEIRNLTSLLNKGEWASGLYAEGNTILVGTTNGRVLQFHPEGERFSVFVDIPQNKEEADPIFRIFRTKEGLLWLIGKSRTFQVQPRSSIFRINTYPKEHDMNLLGRKDEMLTLNGKAYLLSSGRLVPLPENQGEESIELELPMKDVDVLRSYVNDRDTTVWFLSQGYRPQTLFQFDQKGRKLMEFVPTWEGRQSGSVLSEVTMDKEGNIWLAYWNHIGILNFKKEGLSGQIFWFDPDSKLPFAKESALNTSIFCDSRGLIWVGHHNKGISCYDPGTGETHRYTHDWHDNGSISTDIQISNIQEDAWGNIWVGTANGLNKWDSKTKAFQKIIQSNPSYSERVLSVLIDDRQNIWFTAEQHLVKYEQDSHAFYTYGKKDGIPVSRFYKWWTSKDNTGRFFYSSPNIDDGVFYFHPDSVQVDTFVPEAVFKDFQIKNESVKIGASDGLLTQSINFTGRITLKPSQNIFTIRYGAIDYRFPDENRYAVRLDGFQNEWQQVGNKRDATFTNLDPGTYTFQVKVRNHHGFWSKTPRSLNIVILPPWYRTWWAYTIWAALAMGTIYSIYRFQLNRRLAHTEAQHFKALDQAKTRLYTNITHEFRTPLTIILGMAEQVKKDPGNWFNEGLNLIRRNGKQLLNLVNQLLDLSKLESGHLPLNLVQADVVSYLHYLTESFHSYADSKDIRLHFRPDIPELVMDHDQDKLHDILSNLLSNAIKFTPAGGDVYVDVRTTNNRPGKEAGEALLSEILLQVSDTGEGITAEHLPHIFDRFYQADDSSTRRGEGTGIGLALTRELARAMGGRIDVESEPGKGTRFSIWLPVAHKAPQTPADRPEGVVETLSGAVFVEAGKSAEVSDVGPNGRYTVLLVEDNPDVVTYLSSVLSLQFRILTAQNGQEGIEKALELSPDIIVSDVMMPVKDGFELCRELKTDERTSHIPIVLLTAKADQHSRVEGLAYGADAYLAKPFHREELLVRLEKLIELRRRLQERFRQPGKLLSILETRSQNVDELFLQKVMRIIEAQMGDENFGMPQLCKELNMSRTNLFRKLKALTGKSATLLIRSLRLEKARRLLETSEMNVTEATFAVGFNSPNYFARVFREEFGIAPSEVRKSS
ncbi:MAG: response regulator [Lewinellaceae bacterium]|nr:response regulator [Lewinellaceae bacterium]